MRCSRSAAAISAEINAKLAGIQEAFAFSLMPPPILGIGAGSGYPLFTQDRAGLGYAALQGTVSKFTGAVAQTLGVGLPISTYQTNVPQLDAQVDRVKAKAQGVPLTEPFDTMQTYLGSTYVNDFNRFGRTWQEIAQADAPFRDDAADIANLRTRNLAGEIVPIGSVVTLAETYGPDPVMRYNGYPAADLIGEADPRALSSSEAMAAIPRIAPQVLSEGMTMEWADLSFQQATQGSAALIVFPLAVLLVFLVLVALYESWTLPLAMIPIVEFARELKLQGRGIIGAALEAWRLQLRPIMMTSISFIAGTVPLVLSYGADSEVRTVTGITVFAGMLGVTLFGLFLTPVSYVALRKLVALRMELALA